MSIQTNEYDLSIVLIAYNEEEFLEECVSVIINTVNPICQNYEIIITENGSTDKTFQIAQELSKKNSFKLYFV